MPIFVEIGAAGEIDAAIVQLVRQRVQAVVLYSSAFMNDHGVEIVGAATKQGLPTMALNEEVGALINYNPTDAESNRARRLHRPHPSWCKTRRTSCPTAHAG